jgi:hypothetical protein
MDFEKEALGLIQEIERWGPSYIKMDGDIAKALREAYRLGQIAAYLEAEADMAAELTCQCSDAWTGRRLHAPDCYAYLRVMFSEKAAALKETVKDNPCPNP